MAKEDCDRFDYFEMFDIACDFAEVAERASGRTSKPDGERVREIIIPEIVNRAFSCEVFLKALLVYSDISFEHQHAIKKLWNLLPRTLKENTESSIHSRIGLNDGVHLEGLLDNISNSFAKWRYIYEINEACLQVGFLRVLNDSLRDVCCIQFHRQEWKDYNVWR